MSPGADFCHFTPSVIKREESEPCFWLLPLHSLARTLIPESLFPWLVENLFILESALNCSSQTTACASLTYPVSFFPFRCWS